MNGVQQLNEQLVNATEEGNVERVRQLIEARADVDLWALLIRAVYRGHKEIVELLLAREADVDLETLLHGAVYRGHKEIVELLLAKGVDINAVDQRGKVPLDFVYEDFLLPPSSLHYKCPQELRLIYNNHDIAKFLINHIIRLENAGLHVSERNLRLKADMMPKIKELIFFHNHRPLADALLQLGHYHYCMLYDRGDNTLDEIKDFLEGNRDRFKVKCGVHEKSLIDFVNFDATVWQTPTLALCAAVSEVVRNNAPSTSLGNPNAEQPQAVGQALN